MSSTVDGISSLPDDIICHILSFLPTKQAFATSVLSKRWKHLWRSVLSLDFSNTKLKDLETYFRFNDFVSSVLLSRHSVKSFRFEVTYADPFLSGLGSPNAAKWVRAVVQRGVECIHLHIDTIFDIPKLPISILNCRTLVVLKFYCSTVEGFSSVVLPSLKILHFGFVSFPTVGDFLLLLAGCPVLEDLLVAAILYHSLETQERKSLSLSKLTRADIVRCYCHFPLTTLHNVEYLRIEIDQIYRRYDHIPTFHNLTHFELRSLNCKWHLLVQVLKNFPKLQNLDLNEATVEGFREDVQENWVDPEVVPQCLSLHLKTCTLRNFLGLQGELPLARYILKNARVLKTMTIRSKEQLKTERSLSSCPRASATCQLSVIDDNRWVMQVVVSLSSM